MSAPLFDGLDAAGRKQIAFSRSLGRAALKGIARGAQGSDSSTTPSPQASDAASPEAKRSATDGTVEGYAEMTAREAIARIATCNDAEAAFIRQAEVSGKNRVTVIRALDARG